MSSGFVSTSVLESEDGISYSVEKRKQTDEVQDAQALAKRTTGKPLFEQLAEQQQKKQEEYDAVTKLIFSPGKALDEEDVQYFDEVRRRKEKRKAKEREQEEIALKAFRQATLTASSAGSEAVDPASTHTKRRPSPEQHAQSAAQVVIKVRTNSATDRRQAQKKLKHSPPTETFITAVDNSASVLEALGEYGSDDDT